MGPDPLGRRGAVTLFTRSGNTEKPDDSWSDWAGPYSRREGESDQESGRAVRPVARRATRGTGAGAVRQRSRR